MGFAAFRHIQYTTYEVMKGLITKFPEWLNFENFWHHSTEYILGYVVR